MDPQRGCGAADGGTVTGTHSGTVRGTVPGTVDGTQLSPRALPQPLPTTPTPSTSSLSAAQTRGRAEEASLTTRLRAIDERDALARLVLTIRPDWAPLDVMRAIERDDRPWRTVVAGSIRGAAGTDVRHPNGLRYVNPDGVTATPLPPTVRELRTAPTCQHGAASGLCALCRAGLE